MDEATKLKQPSIVWTIGHSSRAWPEFLALLQAQSIEMIVDVRRFAGSRRNPQFGMDRLPPALAAEGIAYLAIPELGGRRAAHADSVNTIWRNPSFRAYADHMQTPEYRHGREQLLAAALAQRAAIMCAEAVWWRCHRSLIADDLKVMGVLVLHIMGPGKPVEHPFTSAASVYDGKLVYGPG
jgi:uncharacterized protein (DUF488 family)